MSNMGVEDKETLVFVMFITITFWFFLLVFGIVYSTLRGIMWVFEKMTYPLVNLTVKIIKKIKSWQKLK